MTSTAKTREKADTFKFMKTINFNVSYSHSLCFTPTGLSPKSNAAFGCSLHQLHAPLPTSLDADPTSTSPDREGFMWEGSPRSPAVFRRPCFPE